MPANPRRYWGAAKIVPRKCQSRVRPTSSFFKDQIQLVNSWAELRQERAPEVLMQIDNQFAFVAAVTGLHPERHRWTTELLVNAILFAVTAGMQFKHALACWRPHQYSAGVQPMITTPGHGSFPSGHSTQAFMLAFLMEKLLNLPDDAAEQLERQAARIATNRVVAGVHFPVDSVAGRLLGRTLAEYVLARLGMGDGLVTKRNFKLGKWPASLDLNIATQRLDANAPTSAFYEIGDPIDYSGVEVGPVLQVLLDHGKSERDALLCK